MYTEIVVSNDYYQIKKIFREVQHKKFSHPSIIVHYPCNGNSYVFAISLIVKDICLGFCLLHRNLTLLH